MECDKALNIRMEFQRVVILSNSLTCNLNRLLKDKGAKVNTLSSK